MKHLPKCPICGEAVRLSWDEATRTVVIRHHFESVHIKEHEFRSPSRRETSAAWIDWVDKTLKQQERWNRPLIWNGFNTNQAVAYCVAWQHNLCHIYSIGESPRTQGAVLCIEPVDTMRGSCLYIPLNAAVIRKHHTWKYHAHNGKLTGHDQYIQVMTPEEYQREPYALKLDRKAYFPHIQHPSAPKIVDGGELPIGAYVSDYNGYCLTPEPWPNPLKPAPFTLYPPGASMLYSSSYASVLTKSQGTPDT